MKRKELLVVSFLFLFITGIFFYKTVLFRQVPFPGDLLVAEYNPWKSYSYLGFVPGSYPNKAQYFDVLRQLYPWRSFAFSSLFSGQIPLWNPYNFSGTPLLANFQSAVFYPFNIVFLFAPFVVGWSILVFLQSFLTGLFTYLYCRKINFSKLASVLSSVSFTFSSFLTVWLEYNTIGHVVLYLPLALFCIESLLQKKSRFIILLFILSIAFPIFAGHPQLFVYELIFLVLYTIFRIYIIDGKNKRGSSIIFFLVLFSLGIGLGAIQWVLGLQLILSSARAPLDYKFMMEKILIQPFQLVMLVVPDFFGNPATRNYWISDTYVGKMFSIGIIPLLLLPFTFLGKQRKLPLFFGCTALVILTLTTANPVTGFLYSISLPFFASSSPTLGIFLFCFSLSILSGFGLDNFRGEKKLSLILKSFGLILILFFVFWLGFFIAKQTNLEFSQNVQIGFKNLLYATGIAGLSIFLLLAGFYKKKLLIGIIVLLILIQCGDLFRSFQKFNPFVPSDLVYPPAPIINQLKKIAGINRFIGYGNSVIEANFATEEYIYSPEGYDPLYPKRYGQFIQSAKNGKIATSFTAQTRSDATVFPSQTFKELIENPYRKKVLDTLGVKYILSRQEDLSDLPNEYEIVFNEEGWKIIKNSNSAPRAFLTNSYKIAVSNSDFEKNFFDPNFNPAKSIVLNKRVNVDPKKKSGKIISTNYGQNKIQFKIDSSHSTLLFLSDTWYPGWTALIDNKETEILRADFAFRAVVVPAGKHNITFLYQPPLFIIGVIISMVSISLTGLFLLLYKRFI